jgi:hypothetical protein
MSRAACITKAIVGCRHSSRAASYSQCEQTKRGPMADNNHQQDQNTAGTSGRAYRPKSKARWGFTTETSLRHHHCVMTRENSCRYPRLVMNGLQHANAFVIQFRDPSQFRTGQRSGRVEHVLSGRTANFQSIEELPQLLLRMLSNLTSSDGQRSE